MPKALRCPAGTHCAAIAVHRGAIGAIGPENRGSTAILRGWVFRLQAEIDDFAADPREVGVIRLGLTPSPDVEDSLPFPL